MPRRLETTKIFEKGKILLRDALIELDDKSRVLFQYWDKPDTAMIVPVNEEGEVIYITEYQTALDIYMLSLPKGRIEAGEISSASANKELQEEIGFRANNLTKIGAFSTIPGYLSGITHVYLAQDLIESRLDGDESWDLPLSKHPLDTFEVLIDTGKLTEMRMITALYEVRRYLESE